MLDSEEEDEEFVTPPDDDKRLVIKYKEFMAVLEIEDSHRNSALYKRFMLKGILEAVVDDINFHIEPIKEEMMKLDRLSMRFLCLGFLSSALIAAIASFLLGSEALGFSIIFAFLLVLAAVFYRNNKKM